ncbi:MAG: hypothetical protein ACLPVO_16675 [Desulfomonilaceae bacterium]
MSQRSVEMIAVCHFDLWEKSIPTQASHGEPWAHEFCPINRGKYDDSQENSPLALAANVHEPMAAPWEIQAVVETTLTAIEMTGTVNEYHELELYDILPIPGPKRVRVVVMYSAVYQSAEREWLK